MPEDFVHINGGEFTMGSPEGEVGREEARELYQQNLGLDYSETQHQVKVSDFAMSKYAVTSAEFRRFVEATGYQTDAEQEGYSVVYLGNNEGGFQDGVNWRHGISGLVRPSSEDNHPVVHVSWNRPAMFCRTALRNSFAPDYRNAYIGFRLLFVP